VSDFPFSLAQYQKQAGDIENDVALHQAVMAKARESGMPVTVESDAEVRLRLLEHDLTQRELRRRSDAGDGRAKALLIRKAAGRELLLDELREAAYAEAEALRAQVQEPPRDPARPGRTPQYWDPPAPSRTAAHG
jgi:hypothetical protein